MSEKKRQTALRQVASLLKDWPEPHGSGSLAVKGVDLQNGHLKVAIEPAMSQCPCCLVDLSVLRVELAKKKGVDEVHIEVLGVPAASRWTTALNS